jgi:hypothetical protein
MMTQFLGRAALVAGAALVTKVTTPAMTSWVPATRHCDM